MKQHTEPCGLDEVCARLEDTQYALGIFDELLARDGLLPASKNRAEQAWDLSGATSAQRWRSCPPDPHRRNKKDCARAVLVPSAGRGSGKAGHG